jgi:hypothetical protein
VRTLTRERAEALEALVDPRLDATALAEALPGPLVESLEESGLLAESEHEDVLRMLARRSAERTIEWGTHTTTQGDVLAAFAEHCGDELADVEVVEGGPTFLEVRWRSETSRFELRNGFLGIDRLASDGPTMLLGEIGPDLRALVDVFLDRPELRAKLAVCDLELLERLGTVRSSAFVYFEWFLRDAYGVKLLPAPAFTQGLIDRGLLSLGMG